MASKSDDVKLTADAVVFAQKGGEWNLLLIQRRWKPFAGLWALPGGHIEPGEDTRIAAERELKEETGIILPRTAVRVGVYNAPGRDPRGRYETHAYAAKLNTMPAPVAADDAKAARWEPLSKVTASSLAFDHSRIVADAMRRLGIRT
ncbi:NUDIX domain-containing protein [Actinokineospora diospyrosa]|uniref:8-oxo-dGTP diphosphatase n=1 Tax=Actinokineospora diospyrosa TaxID=103728 RepID=A0ABT1I6E6_9PSEU|nr:NUDIX hydrolase [Actinokineospora diospyrosa]MCP2268173.1 8-oxo-dGTP diphosphatase [Actinokineospora diospyrosa]